MKPYQTLKVRQPNPPPVPQRNLSWASTSLQISLNIVALSAVSWSLVSFAFSTGFLFRVDPSAFTILSFTDLFSLSFSYIVYLFPVFILITAYAFQFMLPAPSSIDDRRIKFIPLVFLSRVFDFRYFLLFTVLAAPNFVMIADIKFRFIDRTSLLFELADIVVPALSIAAFSLIAFFRDYSGRPFAYLAVGLFVSGSALLLTYVAGDYCASMRINNPRERDCAVLKSSSNCKPVLIWGEKYFLTIQGQRVRAVPTGELDHVWLHPYGTINIEKSPYR